MLKRMLSIGFALSLAIGMTACGDSDSTPLPDMSTGDTSTPDMSTGDGPVGDSGPAVIGMDDNITGTIVDVMGRPGITTVLHHGNDTNKQSYSTKSPADQAADSTLTAAAEGLIDVLYGLAPANPPLQVNGVDLTDVVLKAVLVTGGDVLKINLDESGATYLGVEVGITGAAGGFGGRPLDQDVVDVSLSALTRSAITTDQTGPGSRVFRTTFPYVGPAL